MKTEKATFAAGCFWGIQERFEELEGVISTTVGYTGGHTRKPTYKEVCTGKTGHTEAVQIEYNPEKITYERLLKEFWKIHDPTSPNRQGPDIGTQYRSVIFYHNQEQKKKADKSLKEEQRKYVKDIVTEIKKQGRFYPAEEYHQHYYQKKETGNILFPGRVTDPTK